MRILVLDGQTNQALACVRSLGSAGHSVLAASDRRWPLSSWSRYCENTYRLAAESLEAFAQLRRWACKQKVDLVLPVTERACILCNLERDQWERQGIIVGCAPADLLARAFDKGVTHQLAAACRVSTPPTSFPSSLQECHAAAAAVGFPCVVKPRFSHAWIDGHFLKNRSTAYVKNPQDLEEAVLPRKQGDAWPLIQGFVPGQGRGVFALCDHGRTVAWFAHERLREVRPSGSASSLRRSIRLDSRLRAPAERLLAQMEWHGPAMVEFRDDGVRPPCLMEVNGRFWGSLQLAIEAGAPFPQLWVALLQRQHVEPVTEYDEVILRWLWGDIKRLLYIMAGRPQGYPGTYPALWQGIRELLGTQPAGTRLETWHRADPWPAVGEWVTGVGELLARR